MKILAIATLATAILPTCGCKSIPSDYEPLCSKIASFANSTGDSATHSVELITDWGGLFAENKNTIAEKTCKHGDYGPGADLCAYLMENTSTEFPDANLNAVMVCLGAARPSEIVYDLEYQSTNFWSHVAKGVSSEIIVGVDYSAGSESSAPSLKIMARKDQ